MKARRFLALIVGLVAAAAVAGLLLVATISSPSHDPTVDSNDTAWGILDGWANRDMDIGTL
jgi:hypothetical protein